MSWNVLGKLLTKIRTSDITKNRSFAIGHQTSEIVKKQARDLMRVHAERRRKIECKGGFLQTMEYLRLTPQI